MSYKSDIEIAREANKKPIQEIGAKLAGYVGSDGAKNVPGASLRGWLTKLIASCPPHLFEQIETMFTFKGEVHSLWQSSINVGLRRNEAQRRMDEVFARHLPPSPESRGMNSSSKKETC